MVQKGLFGVRLREGRKGDQKILSQKRNRKDSVELTYISGDALTDAIARARKMSKRILKDVLPRLELVTDEDRLDDYIGACIENGIVALDVETNGKDPIHEDLVGVCLYTEGEKSIYVPLNHRSNLTKQRIRDQIDPKLMKEFIEEMIECGVQFVYHLGKFDINSIFWQLGIRMPDPLWDTYIASNLLNENEPHSLKLLHAKYVKEDENAMTCSKEYLLVLSHLTSLTCTQRLTLYRLTSYTSSKSYILLQEPKNVSPVI